MTTRSKTLPPILQAIREARDAVPLPARVSEMFNGASLRSEYIDHRPAEAALRRYHRKAGEMAYHDDLPIGLRQALKLPLVWNQITHRYPWKVMWVRTVDGKVRRGEKMCSTLGHAIKEWERIREIAPTATVVSRSRGYDIPPKLRGKLPKRWYWCPRCMKPRRYARDENNTKFVTVKKVWSAEKQQYIWKERPVYLLRCPMCKTTNRDPVWRRSNQPWEVRKIKQGVRRIRARKQRAPRKKRRTSAHAT